MHGDGASRGHGGSDGGAGGVAAANADVPGLQAKLREQGAILE